MSLKATRWAWDQSGLTACEKLVLLALADHADNNGRCWPALDRLVEMTNCGRTSVKRAVVALDERGLLTRDPGSGRRSTRYSLPIDELRSGSTTDPLQEVEGVHHGPTTPPSRSTTDPLQDEPENGSGSTTDPQGVQIGPVVGPPRTPNRNEPLIEPLSLSALDERARHLAKLAGREGARRNAMQSNVDDVGSLAAWKTKRLLTEEWDVLIDYAARDDLDDETLVKHILAFSTPPRRRDITEPIAAPPEPEPAYVSEPRPPDTRDYRAILGKVLNHPDRFIKDRGATA